VDVGALGGARLPLLLFMAEISPVIVNPHGCGQGKNMGVSIDLDVFLGFYSRNGLIGLWMK